MTKTVQQHLDANNGAAPGYDVLRLVLSAAILIWHSVYAAHGRFSDLYVDGWQNPVILPLLRGALPMFFFLGGFLVTGSAYRVKSVVPFLIFRALRIVPELFVEVTLSAVVLGACLTTLPLAEYYTSEGFRAYFLNIVGVIHFTLPGVFEHNTVPTTNVVNVNLWTLPPDFEGYAIMAVLIATGIVFNKKYFGWLFVAANVLLLVMLPLKFDWGASGEVYIQPKLLIYSFYLGAACYIFAGCIRLSKPAAALSFLALSCFWHKYTIIVGVWAICYLTLCFGFLPLGNMPLVRRGDYSYGIYLYGFPIERTLFWYFPEALDQWWKLVLAALPVTLLFSALSWHLIEKPCLSFKNRLKGIVTAQWPGDFTRN
jgi:peptidoglycan/LPS O-acetylase OafA/YrhL